MAVFMSVKSHFDPKNLCSFNPKSEKPMKAVIRPLPHNTPTEDISDRLVSLRFDVISVKQMAISRRSPSFGSTNINHPLFPLTSPMIAKFQKDFDYKSIALLQTGWRHIELKMALRLPQLPAVLPRLDKLQATSPLLVVRGRSPTQGVTREREYTLHPNMLKLSVGGMGKPPSSHLLWLQTREGTESQKAPRITTGRVFSSNLSTQGMSFAATFRS
jgi:hypothetical protein